MQQGRRLLQRRKRKDSGRAGVNPLVLPFFIALLLNSAKILFFCNKIAVYF